MSKYFIETTRIGLRRFGPGDLGPFAALNADPAVMEYFPKQLSRAESSELMARINRRIDDQGFGFWAAEELDSGKFIGFVGITQVAYATDFTPAVEIGWRLAKEFWGRGYATEAARGSLGFAFEQAGLDEVVSFTSIHNAPSSRVMERLGMKQWGEFDHPKIENGHRLERHVLYKIRKDEFSKPRLISSNRGG